MNENQWDKLLKIKTTGRDDSHSDTYHYPYEPTPYAVLERLAGSEYIGKKDVVIDYGCGKGRVGFFLNYEIGCRTIGIEYDERIFLQAIQNQETYIKKYNVEFICANAEEFVITDATHFYFFNPFSIEILKSVMDEILDSYYKNTRDMWLYFYYPNDEYLAYLMMEDELIFFDEIDCQDLFDGNDERERILIFKLEQEAYV